MSETNLELDLDTVGLDEERREVARVCVSSVCGFTRSGGAPTISVDCHDVRSLTSEVERLKDELDTIVTEARSHFANAGSSQTPQDGTTPSQGDDVALQDLEATGELLVRDIMTETVRTIGRNEDVSLAKELMDAGQFRHVVVLDEDNVVAGIISRQDIFYGTLAWSLGLSKVGHEKTLHLTKAKAVMSTHVVTTTSQTPVAEAIRLLLDNKVGCLPVVEGADLVGIVTETDVLNLMLQR